MDLHHLFGSSHQQRGDRVFYNVLTLTVFFYDKLHPDLDLCEGKKTYGSDRLLYLHNWLWQTIRKVHRVRSVGRRDRPEIEVDGLEPSTYRL